MAVQVLTRCGLSGARLRCVWRDRRSFAEPQSARGVAAILDEQLGMGPLSIVRVLHVAFRTF